jgi:hypothetical protein
VQIDQAALTGESLPVKKFTGDVAFSGSTVKQGERHALVYATGAGMGARVRWGGVAGAASALAADAGGGWCGCLWGDKVGCHAMTADARHQPTT